MKFQKQLNKLLLLNGIDIKYNARDNLKIEGAVILKDEKKNLCKYGLSKSARKGARKVARKVHYRK